MEIKPGVKKPVNRLKIKTIKAMQEAVDRYFAETKTSVIARDGGVSYVPGPFTVTGLALAMGLTRMSLLRYECRPEFRDTVMRAKARVEEFAESKLYDRGAATGAKFALSNNFEGWREQGPAGINLTVSSLEDAQRFLTGMAGLLQAVEKNVTPVEYTSSVASRHPPQ